MRACHGCPVEVAELIELARRKRIELGMANPRKPGKDGWMGPLPPEEARDPQETLLRNVRWWFLPCRQGWMPSFRWDGAIDNWRKTVVAFSNNRIYIMQRDDFMHTLFP